jgi:hypothetical protein
MAQENKDNAGFSLPDPAAPATPDTTPAATATETVEQQPAAVQVIEDTGSRDLYIGLAVLLVLAVVFFLGKNAYANSLVAKKLPPNKANASAWCLFSALLIVSVGVVLSVVNAARFMTPLVLLPTAVLGLVLLVLTFTTSRR